MITGGESAFRVASLKAAAPMRAMSIGLEEPVDGGDEDAGGGDEEARGGDEDPGGVIGSTGGGTRGTGFREGSEAEMRGSGVARTSGGGGTRGSGRVTLLLDQSMWGLLRTSQE
jgi:hypothetical protein